MEPMTGRDYSVAIILGAHKFESYQLLEAAPAFLGSANALRNYLKNPEFGWGLPKSAILDRFDVVRKPDDLLVEIGKFLDEHSNNNAPVRNLLVYYIGHGFFSEFHDYYLALPATTPGFEMQTSLRPLALARTIKKHAPFFRRFLVLDCCFAGEASKEFMTSDSQLAFKQVQSAFADYARKSLLETPKRGTALLCASSKDSPAIAMDGEPFTMFTGALLDLLHRGEPIDRARFNLETVKELVWKRLLLTYGPKAIRPQLFTPDQTEGDIAKSVDLFANVHSLPKTSGDSGPSAHEMPPWGNWTAPSIPDPEITAPPPTRLWRLGTGAATLSRERPILTLATVLTVLVVTASYFRDYSFADQAVVQYYNSTRNALPDAPLSGPDPYAESASAPEADLSPSLPPHLAPFSKMGTGDSPVSTVPVKQIVGESAS